MDLRAKRAVIDLARRESFSVRGRCALDIECLAGTLWITCDRDSRDLILNPGDRAEIVPAGTAVVQALRPARASIECVPDTNF
jgi:hypothetical protein